MAKVGPKNTYDYSRSKLEDDEIRLLKLYPGAWDSDLIGKLEICRLVLEEDATVGQPEIVQREDGRKSEVAGEYEALSYLWGDGDFLTSLTISENDEMFYLPIKENLFDALQQFRTEIPENDHHLFWIDAVCINQGHAPEIKNDIFMPNRKVKDEEMSAKLKEEMERRAEFKRLAGLEKSAQIKKMADIYKQAYNVRVWLGKETPNSMAAIAFINRILKLDDLDKLAKHPTNIVEWDAFSSLMQRPWFRRRWIVQEIAFARYATVHCGKGWIPWRDFSTAVSLFSLKHMDLNLLFQGSVTFANTPNYLGEVDALGAKTLVETINALFRKSEDGEVIEHRLPLEALMSSLTAFDASFPHDTIYAILRLSYDTKPGSKSSAASMPQVAQHYFPSPQLSPSSPIDSIPMQVMLDGELSQEPHDMLRRESRTGTSSSLGSQIDASSNHLALPPPTPGPGGRKRANSVLQAAAARKKAEKAAETGLEEEPTPFTVDYEKQVFALCKEFLEHVIGRSRSLDIICVPWAPTPPKDEEQMPSWIQNVSGRPYGLKFHANGEVYGRRAADPLVGTPGTGYRNYSACGKTRSYRTSSGGSSQVSQVILGKTLLTCGFVLDTIGDMEPAAMNAVIPGSWAEVAGWDDFSKPAPDIFWRTLVADRVTDGPTPAPGYFQLACRWAFSRVGTGVNLDTGELLTRECPSIAVTFLRRVQAVVWDRCLFLSKGVPGKEDNEDSWLMGLAPKTAKEGDLLCILYGCSVPVVLRKTPKKEDLRKPKRTKTMPPERRHKFATPSDMIVTSRVRSDETKSGGASEKTASRATRVSSNPDTEARTEGEVHELASDNFVTPTASPPTHATVSPMGSPPMPSGSLCVGNTGQGSGTSTLTPSNHSWKNEYTLVGACYVHGMMDGDGFRHQIETGNKLKEFWLV